MLEGLLLLRSPVGQRTADVGLVDRARRRLSRRQPRSGACSTAQQQALIAGQVQQIRRDRRRLAREVHDVLAHSLGAISVQLTSLDCQLEAADAPDDIRERVAGLHRLAEAGLEEAGDAVRSLREQCAPPPRHEGAALTTRLTRLCDLRNASLDIRGAPRKLAPDATFVLYRAAQEALTNAEKHAPHAPVRVALSFEEARVCMCVENGPGAPDSPSRLAPLGGRHGLVGMRERVELIGGCLRVGPTLDGWRVAIDLPGT